MAAEDMHATIEKLMQKATFSMRSVTRNYKTREAAAITRYTPSRQRGCYIRTITERVQMGEKSVVVSLKVLYAKSN
jgi:hypothetical protein